MPDNYPLPYMYVHIIELQDFADYLSTFIILQLHT